MVPAPHDALTDPSPGRPRFTVRPELLELADEFATLKRLARMETPDLDALLDHVPHEPAADRVEVA